MYRTFRVDVGPEDALYGYFDRMTVAHTNLYNSALFVCRQVLSGAGKEPNERQENEKNVLEQIRSALPLMQERQKTEKEQNKFKMPSKGKNALSYTFLNMFFYTTRNQAYFSEDLPRQSAQQTLKQVNGDMKAFFAANRAYKREPDKFLGRPKPPHYKDKGKGSTVVLTNQTCSVRTNNDGKLELQFPYSKGKRQFLSLGDYVQSAWTLKQVTVIPYHGNFQVNILFDDGKAAADIPAQKNGSKRICAIDLGVSNFATMTNNIGKPAMLLKGGVVLDALHHFNKYTGLLQSAQTSGSTEKLKPTRRNNTLLINRENYLRDYIHKSAKLIVNWCKENEIDTLVVGSNKLWKHEANIGRSTQPFEQIPYDRFKKTLQYLCERTGILYVEQEESYTSKASFIDDDFIPVYKKDEDNTYTFSGWRDRRLYHVKDRRIVNADINGSANIGRKAFPGVFTTENCDILSRPIIFRHPDESLINTRKCSLYEGLAM